MADSTATPKQQPVSKEGWVHKQTENQKRWQRRWLSCQGTRLIYYSSPQGLIEKARDIMNLKRASEICVSPEAECGRPGVFKVVMTKRTYFFQAEAPEAAQEWVAALIAAKENRKTFQDEEEDPQAAEAIEKPRLELAETDEVVVVNSYDDFPEGIQKILRKSKLGEDQVNGNIQVILNIVRFLYKKRQFKTDTKASWMLLEEEERRKEQAAEKAPVERSDIFDKAQEFVEEITPKTRKKMFKVLQKLGEGGFGIVHLGVDTATKKQVAIKMMPHVTERHIKTNLRELYYLSILKNPNIVQIYQAYICMDDMWVVEEYMEGGTLTQAVHSTSFKESEVAYVAAEMFKGCMYMHEHHVVHRDIKSANVMMTVKAEVKLIDFGLCGDMSKGKMLRGMVGSPYWMPPEMIRGLKHGYTADTWSAGICLLELCNRKPPKKGNAFKSMFYTGSGKVPPLYKPAKWSELLSGFFADMLVIDHHKRPTPRDLLQHPFLSTDVATREAMKSKLTEIFQSAALQGAGFA